MTPENERSPGKAYGFFSCKASKTEIEDELQKIRGGIGTPSELELSLTECMGNVRGDEILTGIARQAEQEYNMNYMLQATYPSKTNEDAAEELVGILNQASQPPLYEAGEPFFGAIFYEKDGDYVLRNIS
ncbi:hypothetical protein HYW21_04365 [Candidatus Woesearchaeota archaeon]|nr:hypothetical protein [Candidatus Woesearchaeota archaeon]